MPSLVAVIMMCALLAPNLAVKQKVNYGMVFYYGAECESDKVVSNVTYRLRNLGKGTVSFNVNITSSADFNGGKSVLTVFKSGDSSFIQTVPIVKASFDTCKFVKSPGRYAGIVRSVTPLVTDCPIPKGTYRFVDTLIHSEMFMDMFGPSLDNYYTYAGLMLRVFNKKSKLMICCEMRTYRVLLS